MQYKILNNPHYDYSVLLKQIYGIEDNCRYVEYYYYDNHDNNITKYYANVDEFYFTKYYVKFKGNINYKNLCIIDRIRIEIKISILGPVYYINLNVDLIKMEINNNSTYLYYHYEIY